MNFNNSTSFKLSEICGPIRNYQHNGYAGQTKGGLTEEQLELIEKQLNEDHRKLKIVFHGIPMRVHEEGGGNKNLIGSHPVSGMTDCDMYALFREGSSDLKETFEKGRLMAEALKKVNWSDVFCEKVKKGADATPVQLKALFSEVVEQFQNNIASLNEGDLLIMPSGTYSHSIAYVVNAKANGVCTFSIINTGLGRDILGGIEQGKTQAPSFDVPRELLPFLIDPILAFTYATFVGAVEGNQEQTIANFKQALEQFYAKVKRIFADYPEYKQLHVIQAIGYGTCTATCLQAALEIFKPTVLEEIQKECILEADFVVERAHRSALGIAKSLAKHPQTKRIKELIGKANYVAWRALGIENTLGKNPLCVRTKEEDLLGRLNPEFERIYENTSLMFHLLPYDIHKSKYLHNRSQELFGLKHPLEGSHSVDMYDAFRALVPSELADTFEKGLKIAQEFASIQNLINSDSTSFGREIFDSVKEKIRSELQDLRQGELLLINGGTSRHAFVYAVKYDSEETYTISIINTGFGGDLTEDTIKAPAFIVPKELLFKDGRFIQIIIDTAEASLSRELSSEADWETAFEKSMGEMLDKLREFFQGCEEGYFEHFNQVYGTCTSSCLQAAIETFAPRLFEEFRLNSLEKVCEMCNKCREDLLKLREELPLQELEGFRKKIDELLYRVYYFLTTSQEAIKSSTAAINSATSQSRLLGELFRESEAGRDTACETPLGRTIIPTTPPTIVAEFGSPLEFRSPSSPVKLPDFEPRSV